MIGVIGAGAFGTALAVALARGGTEVRLWARDPVAVAQMQRSRRSVGRLAGVALPDCVTVTARITDLAAMRAGLLALPMQQMAAFLAEQAGDFGSAPLVACAKGIDLNSLRGPTALIRAACPHTTAALLTGPSFAADLARGLPTALTLACADDRVCALLQTALSTPGLRLYRTDDVIGAELGGALKNVVAIACGVVIGAGLGESARAALMTRGHAEMLRLALALGARAETLAGLSGLGDLVLTCTSPQSRNFAYGLALGSGQAPANGVTVEGVATARAVTRLAAREGIEMPITAMVAAVLDGKVGVKAATEALLSRPLKQE